MKHLRTAYGRRSGTTATSDHDKPEARGDGMRGS
jgi:hypothetical protein